VLALAEKHDSTYLASHVMASGAYKSHVMSRPFELANGDETGVWRVAS
jgi:hypothetical protein